MLYWCIDDKVKPQWVQDLIDRELLIYYLTPIASCYIFKRTKEDSGGIRLYDGDFLCFNENDDTIGIVYDMYYQNFTQLKEDIPVIKYYCDICGEEILDKDDIYKLKITKDVNSFRDDILVNKYICKHCAQELQNVIDKMENHKM